MGNYSGKLRRILWDYGKIYGRLVETRTIGLAADLDKFETRWL
jgi:hypothetical protein